MNSSISRTRGLVSILAATVLFLLPIHVTAASAVSADTSLSTFQVNGADVADGDTVALPSGTTSVTVNVETTDVDAGTAVTGDTGLALGTNTLDVLVNASDGIATEHHIVTLNVLAADTTSLSDFKIDGNLLSSNSLDLAAHTTSVVVTATPSDSNATVVIVGDTGLVDGENTLTVTVTAADLVTTQDFVVTLNVLLSTDTSLATFKIDGSDVSDGDIIELAPYTTEVTVTAVATDVDATFAVAGATALVPGENTLTVTVTAADDSTEEFTVTLILPLGDNAELNSLTVDGNEVGDGDSIDLAPYTTEVSVDVETTDADATFAIDGDTDLQYGDNTLTVTVTAADGETIVDYVITLVVPLGDNVELSTFQVNGTDVEDGASVDLAPYSTDAEITVETVDPEATFTIDGDIDLVVGENTLTVTVTALDGETTMDYIVTLNVPLGDNVDLSVFQVNGTDVEDAGAIDIAPYSTEAEITVETVDPEATFEIDGGADLVVGENTLTVSVTAVNGETSKDYVVTLIVLMGDNVELSTLQVDGNEVQDGDSIDLEPYTTSVEVTAETVDPEATFVVEGDTDLAYGENTLVVTVTAADGETILDYTITLNLPLGNNVELSAFQVNGEDVEDGGSVDLASYTSEVEVTADSVDPDATVDVYGSTDLVAGENTLTVTVTAVDGVTTVDYVVTLNVALGNNVALSTFQVNGNDVEDGGSIDVAPYSTEVEVNVETADPDATFEVSGGTELVVGENTLTVTVTAVDGETTLDHTVTLNVLMGNDVGLTSFQVNGDDVQDGDSVDIAAYTTSVDVTTVTSDPEATVAIVGDAELVAGENTLTVTVTAADGETIQDYTVTLNVLLGGNVALSTFKVGSTNVENGSVKILPLGTKSVTVTTVTAAGTSEAVVTGASGLKVGPNVIKVVVTAENGTTKGTYKVTVIVPKRVDTLVLPFAQANLITVGSKTNAKANAALNAEVAKLINGKAKIAAVEIAKNFVVAKDAKSSPAKRAAAIRTFLKASKVTNAKTAVYTLTSANFLVKPKGVTVKIYYY